MQHWNRFLHGTEQVGGKTRTIDRFSFRNVEDRDGMFLADMQKGATELPDYFERILKKKCEVHSTLATRAANPISLPKV